MPDSKPGFHTIPNDTHVWWRYRGAIGHGVVVGIHKMGTTADNTMYSVRETDHHVSDSGSHERDVLHHSGAALHTGNAPDGK